MVFKQQDLVKVCELTLINSHCKKEEINAEIQCLFLYVKDLNENKDDLEEVKKAGGGAKSLINCTRY